MVSSDYDVIVVGGGSPGEHCAGALAEGGLRVAVVERGLVGGECSYYACIPSKTLLRPGEAVAGAREAAATAQVDVAAALAYRDFMVSDYSDAGQQSWLAGNGIALLRGTGRLAGPGVVEVGGVAHTARHVVVATGSDPVTPPVPGLRELDGVWTNREVTGMKAVPRRLLILGGGPVGAEMAQAVRRLGGEVALVEGASHVLAREPRPLGDALGEVLRRDGIELILGVQATAARREGQDYVLTLEDGRELRGDRLLVATGRRPRVPGGLDTVGATAGPHGIAVDARLRAGEQLWAVGDVTGVRLLTHVGKYQGEVVAANILGEPREARYEAIPDAVYTDPQAASVGAAEARFTATAQLSQVAKTATYTHDYATSNGFLTLLSDGDHLTGAYALGPEAGEWLQQATLAIRAQVPIDVLRDVIQPFPTFSEIYVDALKALHGQITGARHPAATRFLSPSTSPTQPSTESSFMRADIVPGGTFPDYELTDHTKSRRRLSELQGIDPMILVLSRGGFCPKDHQQHLELAANYPKIRVGYTQIVTISTDNILKTNEFRDSVGAQWTFLSDAGRKIQKDLDIAEYTDSYYNPMIPYTLVLKPGLVIYSLYNGYWFWGRPSFEDLRRDLREVTREIRPDWDLAAPGLRENWETGDHAMHHPYRADYGQGPSAADSPSAPAAPGGAF